MDAQPQAAVAAAAAAHTLPVMVLPAALFHLLGAIFVYHETQSSAVVVFTCTMPGIAIVMTALNTAFPVDLEGRLVHSPGPDYTSQNQLWSLSLRAFLQSTALLAGLVALSHAVLTAEPCSRVSDTMPLTAELSVSKPLASSAWLGLPTLAMLVAIVCHVWFNIAGAPYGKQQVRELLGMDIEQSSGWTGQSLQFLTGVCGCAVLFSLVLYSSTDLVQGLLSAKRQQAEGNWHTNVNKRHRADDTNVVHEQAGVDSEAVTALMFIQRHQRAIAHARMQACAAPLHTGQEPVCSATTKHSNSAHDPSDLSASANSVFEGMDFELVVQSNYDPRHHLQQCNCSLCSKQGMVLVSNDCPLVVEGRFRSGPPDSADVKVVLQHVVIHKPTDGSFADGTSCDVGVIKELAVTTGAAFRVEVPAKHLLSTYHGIATTKKQVDKSHDPTGTFHTHLRAEVTCIGVHKAQTFRVYSPQVYVSGGRNFRRISNSAVTHSSRDDTALCT